MKMLTATEARTKTNANSSKLSSLALILINKKIKRACHKGQAQVNVQIGLIPLEYDHAQQVLSVLAENGYNCSAHRLKTVYEEDGDWMFTIKW